MIDPIHFLVPNLTRRPDRWRYCEQSLLDQGVPREMITRFPAVDGLAFLKDDNHLDTSLIDVYMEERYEEWKPSFLDRRPDVLTAYAWKCTWLLSLQSIIKNLYGELTCFMIDDMVITAPYRELLDMANALISHCDRQKVPFLAAQLGESPKDKNITRIIGDCPIFQSGFATGCDHAFLYSGMGAKFVKDFANLIAKDFVDPAIVAKEIAELGAYPGVFGISGLGEYASGIAFLDVYLHNLKSDSDVPDGITDHGRSSWELERKERDRKNSVRN